MNDRRAIQVQAGCFYAAASNPRCTVRNVGVRMSISQDEKTRIIREFATREGDTGSPDVQIAVLTAEIQSITEHLQGHPKDYSSRRGLLSKVSRRRQLLDYVKRGCPEKYLALITRLNIRK
jgi:small subunit ribosomal protein S15